MKVLVVEDNIKLLKSISDELNNHFETESCSDGEEALYMIEQNIYDLIVLDLMRRAPARTSARPTRAAWRYGKPSPSSSARPALFCGTGSKRKGTAQRSERWQA